MRFRPLQPQELACCQHLILAGHAKSVMNVCLAQTVLPGSGQVIGVSASIQGNILTLPPQIHVQQVGMGGARMKAYATQRAPDVYVSNPTNRFAIGLKQAFTLYMFNAKPIG
ncbi:hypothetical protein SDC9_170208 [bioreactor metagenome]|uniref:Uncharacterized protein n=1 Tax=bioreactor metagenome TaxID=1076179 RepID=A0A645GFT9_9ZZZZ